MGSTVYRFRPLESELKGLRFGELADKLQSLAVWEFSVATGAINIGYSEYVGGLVEGDLLVFVYGDGEQAIYHWDSSIEKKHFTIADTKSISISERTAPTVNEIIGRQLAQATYFFFLNSCQMAERGTFTSGRRRLFRSRERAWKWGTTMFTKSYISSRTTLP